MELTYPINLIGYDDGETKGDVITRYGEYLGKWAFSKNEEEETGDFHFFQDGETEPLFSEGVPFLFSGMLTGLAMSKICRAIGDWHEDGGQNKAHTSRHEGL